MVRPRHRRHRASTPTGHTSPLNLHDQSLKPLFGEERRRLKIVPNAFGEKPVLKLLFGALIRAAETLRGLRFTEFELFQLKAMRKDLDAEYEAPIAGSDGTSRPPGSSKSAP